MAMTVHGIIRMHGREHRQKFNKRRTGAATASSPLSVYKKSSAYYNRFQENRT